MNTAITKDALYWLLENLPTSFKCGNDWTMIVSLRAMIDAEQVGYDPWEQSRMGFPGVAPPPTKMVIYDHENRVYMTYESVDQTEGM